MAWFIIESDLDSLLSSFATTIFSFLISFVLQEVIVKNKTKNVINFENIPILYLF